MEKAAKKRAAEMILGCLLLFSVYFLAREGAQLVSQEMESRKTVVVDAGHGGRDPGKVGVDGQLEKDLNLAIAKFVKEDLEAQGCEVVMTRTKDEMISEPGSGSQKVQDLENRCRIINGSGADCAVSIHQNSYSDEAVKGAQVFYFSDSAKGRELADFLQQSLVTGLDPKNHRKAKENDTYYLLKKTEIPLVIVECGFLSNWEEAAKLSDASYQEQAARAVADGVMTYLREN